MSLVLIHLVCPRCLCWILEKHWTLEACCHLRKLEKMQSIGQNQCQRSEKSFTNFCNLEWKIWTHSYNLDRWCFCRYDLCVPKIFAHLNQIWFMSHTSNVVLQIQSGYVTIFATPTDVRFLTQNIIEQIKLHLQLNCQYTHSFYIIKCSLINSTLLMPKKVLWLSTLIYKETWPP